MGLFDKLFNRNKNKENQVDKPKEFDMLDPQIGMYPFFGIAADGKHYCITNCEVKTNPISHRDGRVTVAVMAKIQQAGPEDTIIDDYSKYISFEIAPGARVTKAMCQELIEEYAAGRGNGTINQRYLGEFSEEYPGEVNRTNESAVVANGMEKIAGELLEARRQQLAQRRQENEARQKMEDAELRARFEAEARKRDAQRQQTINKRKSNPYFIGKSFAPDNMEEYDGINLSTGDIMRLRAVNMVGKTNSGTCLYTGFIKYTPNSDDCEYFGKNGIPDGYPIAFETDLKLDDIAQSKDTAAMIQILSLLTIDPKKLSDLNLAYVGKLSRDGSITRNAMSDSQVVNDRVAQLRQEFKQKIMNKYDGR